MPQNANNNYMEARMRMNVAIEEFIAAAYRVDFPVHSIGDSIMDSVYDIDTEVHESIVATVFMG